MNRTSQVFVACTLGAGIGTLVALQLHPYLWWIGLIAGGLVGYFSYEPKQVLGAIHSAWQKVAGYRPEKEALALRFWRVVVITILFASLYSILYLSEVYDNQLLVLCWIILPYAALFTRDRLFLAVLPLEDRGSEHYMDSVTSIAVLKKGLWVVNPVGIYIYTPLWLSWKILKGMVKYTPRVLSAVVIALFVSASFVLRVIVEIHSDVRLLCAFCAAIGASIGYMTGNVLIGALAGGVVGVANYEIVSRHILRIVRSS